jgi:calcineurin-like phosphoesterase family protein
MNGRLHLIRGNHERGCAKQEDLFVWIKDLYTLKVKDADAPGSIQNIVLCHYPMRSWNKSHWGSWMCCAHSHGGLAASLPESTEGGLLLDVGVDVWNYHPVSYEQVKSVMKKKKELLKRPLFKKCPECIQGFINGHCCQSCEGTNRVDNT